MKRRPKSARIKQNNLHLSEAAINMVRKLHDKIPKTRVTENLIRLRNSMYRQQHVKKIEKDSINRLSEQQHEVTNI